MNRWKRLTPLNSSIAPWKRWRRPLKFPVRPEDWEVYRVRDRDFTYAVTSCDDDLSRFAGMFQCQGRWRYSDACDKRTKSKSFKGVTSVTCLLGKVAWNGVLTRKTSCRFLTQSHPQHGFGSGRCHGCFGYGTPGMQCQNVPTLRWSHQGRPYLTVRIHICWYLYNLYISEAEFMTEETRWVVMSFDEFRYQGWSIPFRWNHPKSKRLPYWNGGAERKTRVIRNAAFHRDASMMHVLSLFCLGGH